MMGSNIVNMIYISGIIGIIIYGDPNRYKYLGFLVTKTDMSITTVLDPIKSLLTINDQ